jgi:hypothetical protein
LPKPNSYKFTCPLGHESSQELEASFSKQPLAWMPCNFEDMPLTDYCKEVSFSKEFLQDCIMADFYKFEGDVNLNANL